MNNSSTEKILSNSKKLRKLILKTALGAGSSAAHLGGALSILDIMNVLFTKVLNYDVKNPQFENRDRIILSKGHACLALYSCLSHFGFFDEKLLDTFEKNESDFLGHPIRNKNLGIEFSTGSLGMGLSIGIGVAHALKKKDLNNKVYVFLGDGECNEGSVWESIMLAPKLSLDNLVAIVDKNNFQQTGTTKDILINEYLTNKFENFGWESIEIDGHNINQITNCLNKKKNNKPLIIVANTIKGKGIKFAESNNAWHHNVLTKSKYDEAILDIDNE